MQYHFPFYRGQLIRWHGKSDEWVGEAYQEPPRDVNYRAQHGDVCMVLEITLVCPHDGDREPNYSAQLLTPDGDRTISWGRPSDWCNWQMNTWHPAWMVM